MASSSAPLPDVIAVARPIVERIVWCTVATVGPDSEPRSRLMHPVWWWGPDGATALVTARPTPIKVAHLRANRCVTCFYWDQHHDTVAVDATADWLPPDERAEAWREIEAVPPPMGFDPALVWPEGPAADDCAFLRLRATRIVATPAGRPGVRWTSPRTW